jgi:cell division septation protein DedD
MRDAHRMKERIDVSLDNRHVVSLLIAGIIVFGAVFILGVVVGKKLAGNESAAHAPDLLSALDQKAAAVEPPKDAPLTFQDELTKKAPPAVDPTRVRPTVAPVIPAPRKTPPVEVAAPPPDEVKVNETIAVSQRSTPEPTPPAAPAIDSHRAVLRETVRATPRVETTPVAARMGTKERNLRDAITRVERKPTSSAEPGSFTLQISSTQMRPEADRVAARLRNKGYAPFVVQAEVPGRGKWYRVRLGNFATKEAATRYLADFRRETRLDGFVTNH